MASTVNLVIAQRLVRRICTKCIISYSIPDGIKTMINDQISQAHLTGNVEIPQTLFKGNGCNICGKSGYTGQTAIFELLQVTEDIRRLILSRASNDDIRVQATKDGMISMLQDGLKKVEQGITTIEEVLRVTRE